MFDLTLQQLIVRLAAYLFIVAVHGFALAAAAVALRDPGPRYDGRLSLNPFVHLDVLGVACGILFSVGWIRPIAVDPKHLRFGRAGLPIVVAAALAATLLAAVALKLARPFVLPLLPDTAAVTMFGMVESIGELSLWFVLANVLPLPPLTGALLLMIVRPEWGEVLRRFHTYAAVAAVVVAAVGAFAMVLGPAYRMLARPILG